VFGSKQFFKAGRWMHLAVTWTSNSGAVFVNGEEDGRSELKEGLPEKPLPETMQIGAVSSWINAGACGIIADFTIYSRALEQKSIQEIIQ